MKAKLSIFILLVLLISSTGFSQNQQLEYNQKLSISEGLAHNGVTCLLEDSQGYLWISTYDGLNRYDGYECKIYKNTLAKKLFVSNRIRTIAEDKNGNIWIGTDEGISIYNHQKEEFRDIYSNIATGKGTTGPIVRKIIQQEKDEKIICATEGEGILIFNSDFSLAAQHQPPANLTKSPILFHEGFQLDDENYVFSTSAGIVLFNCDTGEFFKPFPEEKINSKSIVRINDNKLLAIRDNGLIIYTYNKVNNLYKIEQTKTHFMGRQFNSCAIDKLGNLWLGTAQFGVIHIDNAEDFANNKTYKRSYFSTETGYLRTSYFLPTENHGCWVGSFNKGLFQFNLREKPFKYVNTKMQLRYGLKTNEVLHANVVDADRIFVSANTGGSALFNTSTEKYEPLPFAVDKEYESNTSVVLIDSNNDIWVKQPHRLGIVRRSKGLRTIETINIKDFPGLANLSPRKLVEDKFGNIWMGCAEGLFKLALNSDKKTFSIETLDEHPMFQNNHLSLVRNIYPDPMYNFLWVGTGANGLLRIATDENIPIKETKIWQYTHTPNDKNSLSSDFVTTIKRLPNSELWIGTERGGINKVLDSENTPKFIALSEKDGLSNNVVKRILYDDDYNLWIPTNIGLNKFDIKSEHFTIYGKQDGLPFEDFLYSSAKLKNGNMLFSCSDGFIYFNPNDIRSEEVLPKIKFGEITVFNERIQPGEEYNKRILIEEYLEPDDELVLKHNENVFSVELLSLHYSTPENHFIKYRLLPLNEEWIEVASSQRNISYNGLRPNKYTLEVMASNAQNEWSNPVELNITVTPPFWVTVPAFILYFILLALITYSVIYYFLRLNKLQHKLEIEELEKDKVKEVNAAKLRFFSNISHEIKTPLTLISGPVNLLAERFKTNDDVREKLQIIQRQSRKMLRLVNQVHDFQRSDANQLKMNYSQFCFNNFLDEILTDFKYKADNDKKELKVKGPEKKIFVSADYDKLEKILNNLLNNAFKFTKEGDSITVEYSNINNELLLKVTDTGKGVDKEDLPFIFDRFYQSKKKHSQYTGGSGIGLAFSKRLVEMHYGNISVESLLGKGSAFIVNLPVISNENIVSNLETEEKILEKEKEFDSNQIPLESIDPARIKVSEEFSDVKIFFAEDNSDMRKFISGILSNFFKVTSFINGLDCLKAMEEEWPDIVISDVLMPEMNGFDLCKQVKSDIKTSHIPVILLTACTSIDEQLQGLEVGADAYIKKPFNVQHLVTRTETLLKNRQALRKRFQLGIPLSLDNKEDNSNDIAFLEKLYSLMEKNLDNQDLDLDKFAKELYLNRTHFYQKVKALTNQTPFELLKAFRLKKAAEFLGSKQYTVNEVYLMTGFKSRTHFSKLFKETYKVTPGKYASEINEKL